MTIPGAHQFVGRDAELQICKAAIAGEAGQMIIVCGQQGFGKSALLGRILHDSTHRIDLDCYVISHQATESDSFSMIADLLLNDAVEALQPIPSSFSRQRLEQWQALLNVVGIGDLIASLVGKGRKRHPREALSELFDQLSLAMPATTRLIIAIDATKYLNRESREDWVLLASRLPRRIKIILTQRSDDMFGAEDSLLELERKGIVKRIPSKGLGRLAPADVRKLAGIMLPGHGHALARAIEQYEGHPYATVAALRLLQEGVPWQELPTDPTPDRIAAQQWKRVKRIPGLSIIAVKIFETLAVLELPLFRNSLAQIASVSSEECAVVLADPFLGSLLIAPQGTPIQIYHSFLIEHIQSEVSIARRDKIRQAAVKAFEQTIRAHRGHPPAFWTIVCLQQLSSRFQTADQHAKTLANVIGPELQRSAAFGLYELVVDESLGRLLPDSTARVALLIDKGNLLGERGDDIHARQNYEEAILIARKHGDIVSEVTAQENLLNSVGLPAVEERRKFKNLFENAGEHFRAANASLNLAIDLLYLGRNDEAASELEWAKNSKGGKHPFLAGRVLIVEGRLHQNSGRSSDAIAAATTAAVVGRDKGNYYHAREALVLLSKAFVQNGEVEQAIDASFQAYAVSPDLGSHALSHLNERLTDIISELRNDSDRLKALKRIELFALPQGLSHVVARAWNAIGGQRLREREFDSASKAFEHAISIGTEKSSTQLVSFWWNLYACRKAMGADGATAKEGAIAAALDAQDPEGVALIHSLLVFQGDKDRAHLLALMCRARFGDERTEAAFRESAEYIATFEGYEALDLGNKDNND